MANITDLQTKIDAAVAAIDGGDWQLAKQLALSASVILIGIPDTIFDGNDQIRFDRQGTTEILKQISRQANAQLAASAGSQDVRYLRDGRNGVFDP